MTIEILKPAPKKYIKNCRKCGCRFSHTREDVTHHYQPFDGDFVDCPTCGESIRHENVRNE